jgi:hypothetical protein
MAQHLLTAAPASARRNSKVSSRSCQLLQPRSYSSMVGITSRQPQHTNEQQHCSSEAVQVMLPLQQTAQRLQQKQLQEQLQLPLVYQV